MVSRHLGEEKPMKRIEGEYELRKKNLGKKKEWWKRKGKWWVHYEKKKLMEKKEKWWVRFEEKKYLGKKKEWWKR